MGVEIVHRKFSGISLGEDLVADARANSKMIKDRDIVFRLDDNFKGSVSNANFSDSRIQGKSELDSE